jgi:sporulation protein YlmC with PRC-barrel domain
MDQITSDDILGKDVVDSEGEIIGVVQKIHIDKKIKQIIGITIDEGFMKPDLFIGLDYVKNFGVDSIFLNMIPNEKYLGLKIFDKNGKLQGTVSKIETVGTKIKSIEYKSRFTTYKIPASKIKKIIGNVILK